MGMLEKYELTISSNEINSTDSRFTMDNLSLGDDYKIIDVKFETADGQIIRRRQKKFERKMCIRDSYNIMNRMNENPTSLTIIIKRGIPTIIV